MMNIDDLCRAISDAERQGDIPSKNISMDGRTADVVSPRLIRHWTTMGWMDKPHKIGREARYSSIHLSQALAIRKGQVEGVGSKAIGLLLSSSSISGSSFYGDPAEGSSSVFPLKGVLSALECIERRSLTKQTGSSVGSTNFVSSLGASRTVKNKISFSSGPAELLVDSAVPLSVVDAERILNELRSAFLSSDIVRR